MRTATLVTAGLASFATLLGCSDSAPQPGEAFEVCLGQSITVGDHEVEYETWLIAEPAQGTDDEGNPVVTTSGEFRRYRVDGQVVDVRVNEPLVLETLTLDSTSDRECMTLTVAEDG